MRNSISRSSAEKACPSPALFSSASRVARSDGEPGIPSLARSAESHPCAGSTASWLAINGASGFVLVDLTLMACTGPAMATLFLARPANGVGILETEPGQNLRFEPLHLHRLGFALMVVADEVQEAVEDKMLSVGDRLDAPLSGLPGDGFGGQHDVTKVAIGLLVRPGAARPEGKRQHIGRGGLAAIGGIQAEKQGVAAEHDGGLPATHAGAGGMLGEGRAHPADCQVKARKIGPCPVLIADLEAKALPLGQRRLLVDRWGGAIGGSAHGSLSAGARKHRQYAQRGRGARRQRM